MTSCLAMAHGGCEIMLSLEDRDHGQCVHATLTAEQADQLSEDLAALARAQVVEPVPASSGR